MEHKTVFILDHGPAMAESSNQLVDFDISIKSRPQGVVPLAPVSKSLWSSCIEALCEYCRIVWDVFPSDKLLRFIISDSSTKFLNSWDQEEQTMAHLMKSLAIIGPPLNKSDCSVMLGLVSSVEALCDLTSSQKKSIAEGHRVDNKGRIICITQLKNDTHRKAVIDCVADSLNKHHDLASSTDGMLPLSTVQLVLIHVKPFGSDCVITEQDLHPHRNNPRVFVESHDVKATRHGIAIANRMLNLVRRHYDLSVTSITGIPMKEEQHANSSANYDVLLLHRRLPGTSLIEPDRSTWDGELTSTMLLKWCSPKINVNELFHCTGAARVSPVDVNSRPSLCLTNFLLNGRSVLLEHWIKGIDGGVGSSAGGSNRQMTHMISCRGTDIFLHALGVNRTPFEDPPSISDGPGGKVTDYRINEFAEIMKEGQLLPLGGRNKCEELPMENAISKMERLTRCWPLVFSKTILFNMSKSIDPLIDLVMQETLSADGLVSCQRVIYHLIGLEREGVALPVVTTSGGLSRNSSKQHKKEEHYKSMWNELEEFLRAHSSTSTRHGEVLDCLLECIGKSSSTTTSGSSKSMKTADVKRSITTTTTEVFESPESPPPLKKQKNNCDVTISMRPQKGAQSLLSMWTQRIENTNSQRHVEFYGRLASDGNKSQLYPNIEEDAGGSNASANQDRQGARHGHHRFSSHHHRSGSGGNRDDPGRSGRSTPQGKQKIMKKPPKSYPT